MKSFSVRLRILCIIFALFAVLCVIQIFRYAVLKRPALTEEIERISWREGTIPAPRGRILDSAGIELAWTELKRDAVLERWPASQNGRKRLTNLLKEQFGIEVSPDSELPLILARDLSPGQLERFAELEKIYTGLVIRTRIERKRVEYDAVRERLGSCMKTESGALTGADGLELQFNDLLTGQEGRYRVMVDRVGNWIADTLKIIDEGKPGQDLILKESLAELKGGPDAN